MIELAINGWILSVPGIVQVEKYIYTIEAVDNYLINNHFDELINYVNSRQVGFGDCVTTEFDGINSEAFFNNEVDKFTVLFMLGQQTNFL
jgi:hypothetical protein